MSQKAASPRFLVVQNGARHDYAIPDALRRAGALDRVYTDFVTSSRLGSALRKLTGRQASLPSAFKRREPPSVVEPYISSWGPLFLARHSARRVLPAGRISSAAENLLEGLRQSYLRAKGFGDATHLYSMLGEPKSFLSYARRKGLFVVSDVYIAISSDAIVANESRAHPDWADPGASPNPDRDPLWINRAMLQESHLLVCPSEFVRDDLVHNFGIDERRTVVAPYAVNTKWLDLEPETEPGRVLFAGSATIRKGIHHLAAAAKMLEGECEVRIAGGVSDRVRNHPEANCLEFLGHLGQEAMAKEFSRADVFVLPSLAEGSASVTAEALGAGVPVVTTKAAGSIVRDGIDGIIVPEKDPQAIARAVRSIVSDRMRREAMSTSARERAQQFTWDGFAEIVLAAAKRIAQGGPANLNTPDADNRLAGKDL